VNLTFQPQDIVIQLGDTVRWIHGGGFHDVVEGTDGTIDGDEAFFGLLDSLNPVFEVTFDQALLDAYPRPGNVYDYFCSPHIFLGMVGTVTVLAEPGSSFCDCTDAGAAPCGNAGGPGEGCRNSGGSGARLGASGSSSVAAGDLVFGAQQLRPGQPALLFVGQNAINNGNGLPFGDGLRCAGVNVVRLGVRVPDSGGNASWGPGLAGGWNQGDTRRFQVWYRDPAGGGVCGTAFNLSNGYEITFGA
jgi:plastocyanin